MLPDIKQLDTSAVKRDVDAVLKALNYKTPLYFSDFLDEIKVNNGKVTIPIYRSIEMQHIVCLVVLSSVYGYNVVIELSEERVEPVAALLYGTTKDIVNKYNTALSYIVVDDTLDTFVRKVDVTVTNYTMLKELARIQFNTNNVGIIIGSKETIHDFIIDNLGTMLDKYANNVISITDQSFTL